MSTLTLEIEKELPTLEAEAARQFERAVIAMLRMARRKEPDKHIEGPAKDDSRRARYTLPAWNLGVTPGQDLTKLAHFEDEN